MPRCRASIFLFFVLCKTARLCLFFCGAWLSRHGKIVTASKFPHVADSRRIIVQEDNKLAYSRSGRRESTLCSYPAACCMRREPGKWELRVPELQYLAVRPEPRGYCTCIVWSEKGKKRKQEGSSTRHIQAASRLVPY